MSQNETVSVNSNVVAAVRELTRETITPQLLEKIHYVAVPKDCTLQSLQQFQFPEGVPPTRVVAAPRFHDSGSFSAYVNTFNDSRSRIMADVNTASFVALLDYHEASDDPHFVSHKASFKLTPSVEWNLWTSNNDKLINQVEFAEFLEDNRADVISPSAAEMLDVARDLVAKSDVNFASKINSVNGSATLSYQETVSTQTQTGQIQVPETFVIRIPVFYGESPVEITARLRFRIGDQKLRFQYKLYRPEELKQQAFNKALENIQDSTEIIIWQGTQQ